jgi:hypothetical protein
MAKLKVSKEVFKKAQVLGKRDPKTLKDCGCGKKKEGGRGDEA